MNEPSSHRGTAAYHIGEPPDRRSAATALRRGVVVTGRARRLEDDDYYEFDHIVAMDRSNLAEIMVRKPAEATARIHLLRSFDPEADEDADVPDPYYGGPSGFDDVHDIVERSTRALLAHLMQDLR
jgi:protein-tyrosine phosphatase